MSIVMGFNDSLAESEAAREVPSARPRGSLAAGVHSMGGSSRSTTRIRVGVESTTWAEEGLSCLIVVRVISGARTIELEAQVGQDGSVQDELYYCTTIPLHYFALTIKLEAQVGKDGSGKDERDQAEQQQHKQRQICPAHLRKK